MTTLPIDLDRHKRTCIPVPDNAVVEVPASNWSRELVKAIAADIGADTVAYIEVMYPNAIKATSSTFKTSIRNHIYNQIMAAIEVNDAGEVVARLADRKKFRRWWVGVYRKIRRKNTRALTDDERR